jgi:hypothetical protein
LAITARKAFPTSAPGAQQNGMGGAMRMAEHAAEMDEQKRAEEWSDYLAFEEEERRINEQQEQSSTQH